MNWNYCEDKLPKRIGAYIVTYDRGDKYCVGFTCWSGNDWEKWVQNGNSYCPYIKIIAWAAFPKSAKEIR